MKTERIPRATIQRLAAYVQALDSLRLDGMEVVSSDLLARECAVSPSQVRKDLAYFGEFGVRGKGYHVEDLAVSIRQALNVDRTWMAALFGVGNLGRALLRHREFRARGFLIVAAFDSDPFKIGEEVAGLEVYCPTHLKEKARELVIEIGIVTSPPGRAQQAVDYLVDAGVKGILNFSPTRVEVPGDVFIEYVDFFNHIFALAFSITQAQLPPKASTA